MPRTKVITEVYIQGPLCS